MAILFKKLLTLYQMVMSPWLGTRCRFVPTCSEYAKQSFEEYDVFTAILMTSKRICRCHPWGGHGFDPVTSKTVNPQTDTKPTTEKR